MLFTDPLFLFYFLPTTLLAVKIASISGKFNFAIGSVIIIATLIFYSFENILWVGLFLSIAFFSYGTGLLISKANTKILRILFLSLGIGNCLITLSLFKYVGWLSNLIPILAEVKDPILPFFGNGADIILPAGISFYTFEAISFIVDIYRKKISFPKNPIRFLAFIAMFPRFIAGPIVRYSDVESQFDKWRSPNLSRGLTLFSIGFSMKILIADQFAIFTPYAFEPANPDFVQSWIGTLSYSFQLYYDFWAYSIMATGLGLCLGFSFPDNFRSPYKTTSITEFWRHWHITLSHWLRDYLYISLGGSRCTQSRRCINLLLTMIVAGVWHGAGLTFMAWGAYHGILLAFERIIDKRLNFSVNIHIKRLLTFFLVLIGWVTFKSTNFEQAIYIYKGLFGLNSLNNQFNYVHLDKNGFALFFTILGLVFFAFGEKFLVRDTPISMIKYNHAIQILLFFLFLFSILVSTSSTTIPFLYFQF